MKQDSFREALGRHLLAIEDRDLDALADTVSDNEILLVMSDGKLEAGAPLRYAAAGRRAISSRISRDASGGAAHAAGKHAHPRLPAQERQVGDGPRPEHARPEVSSLGGCDQAARRQASSLVTASVAPHSTAEARMIASGVRIPYRARIAGPYATDPSK